MLKMIIVDDEQLIRESLKKFIDWSSIGVEVIDTVGDGTSALDVIVKKTPDIVLSDISMPFLNGIELIKILRKLSVKSEIIFLTAYSNFNYAQSAIKYGAFDYILKPIDESALLETVKRCTVKINTTKNDTILKNSDNNIQNLQLTYTIKSLMTEQRNPDEKEIALLHSYGITKNIYPSVIAANFKFKYKVSKDFLSSLTFSEYRYKFKTISLAQSENQLTLLFFSSENNHSSLLNNFTSTLSEYTNNIDTTSIDAITISDTHNLIEVFSKLAVELSFPLIYEYTNFALISYKKPLKTQYIEESMIHEDILESVKTANIQSLTTALQRLFINFNIDDIIYDLYLVKLKCIEIIDTLIASLQDYYIEDTFDYKNNLLNFKKDISSQKSLYDVYTTTKHIVAEFINYIDEVKSKPSKRLVTLTLEYIHKYYSNDINLNEIARKLYISPNYLSTIFSKTMHQPFSNYLLNYRIDIAKTLLRDPKLKIYNVSEKVGYSDVAHFSKSFKQVVGMSPNKYKNLKL